MHVRIAWEILHHQKKENPDKTSTTPNLTKSASVAVSASAAAATASAAAAAAAAATATANDMHRPPTHIFPSAGVLQRPPELSTTFPPGLAGRPYDTSGIPPGFLGPASHLGTVTFYFVRSYSIKLQKMKILMKKMCFLSSIQICRKCSVAIRPICITV